MAFGNFGDEPKAHIGADFTINQYENASANYEKKTVYENATATLSFKDTVISRYENGYITLVSADLTELRYVFQIDGRDPTGTDLGSNNIVVQLNGLSATRFIAAQFQAAINSANGHNAGSTNSVLSMTLVEDTISTLTLTQVVAGPSGNTAISPDGAIITSDQVETPASFSGGDITLGGTVRQVPFSLGLSGVLPFNIGSVASRSAYTMTKGKASS